MLSMQPAPQSRSTPIWPASLGGFLLLALIGSVRAEDAQETGVSPLVLDHVIERGNRIEFYRRVDFGPPGSACHPCLTAQHAQCDVACYEQLPSLSLICSPSVHGLSVGPFDRDTRGQQLSALLRTDSVRVATQIGVESLQATRISTVQGLEDNRYAIDLEGFEGFKNTFERAYAAPQQFEVEVGQTVYSVPLSPRTRDGLYLFLKQCPD